MPLTEAHLAVSGAAAEESGSAGYEQVVGEGILNGYPQDNTLRPQGALTRAEAAAILMNRAEAAAN